MFQPSQQDVRAFFCGTRRKQLEGALLSPIEAQAASWIDAHPEYHAALDDEPAALAASYALQDGRENPFLHLSMHLSITEQAGIDQPTGIRQQLHDAHHEVMECLGEMIWQSQRSGLPPDGQAYIDRVRRRAMR
jgi:Domain of unknown function (DUF1841)